MLFQSFLLDFIQKGCLKTLQFGLYFLHEDIGNSTPHSYHLHSTYMASPRDVLPDSIMLTRLLLLLLLSPSSSFLDDSKIERRRIAYNPPFPLTDTPASAKNFKKDTFLYGKGLVDERVNKWARNVGHRSHFSVAGGGNINCESLPLLRLANFSIPIFSSQQLTVSLTLLRKKVGQGDILYGKKLELKRKFYCLS